VTVNAMKLSEICHADMFYT